MTAWYQEINVIQEPFDMGIDGVGRIKFGFNISAVKRPSRTFYLEIVGILVAAMVGTFGTDIFVSSAVDLPDGDGPMLNMTETGGTTPLRTHNTIGPPAYQRPTAQIVARARSTAAALSMAQDAYEALVGIRNINVAG